MAKKSKPEGDAKKGKAKKIVGAAVLVVVGVLAGGKLMGGGSSQAAADGTTTTTTKPAGPVVAIDPITVNLSDGHVLKVGIALELETEKADTLLPKEGGSSKDTDPTKGFASGLDAAVSVFGAKTYDTLLPQPGRDAARAELRQKLEERYPGAITNIYLYEFVMQ